jgi:hypothetical protein
MTDRGIRMLSDPKGEYVEQFSGLLATVDPANDPIAVYEALCSYGAPMIDLMLPYNNWDKPPVLPEDVQTPYADSLLTVFHRWQEDRQAQKPVPDIRLFSSILNLSRGMGSLTEAIGPLTSRVLFVRADGSIEHLDSLKATAPEEVATGMHISEEGVLEAMAERMRRKHQLGRKALAEVCRKCDIVEICGAGHLETRYSREDGFDRESVFHEDLKKLIDEIVATTNALDRDRQAAAWLPKIQDHYGGTIPTFRRPLYTPVVLPPKKTLATHVRTADFSDSKDIALLQGDAFYEYYKGLIPKKQLEQFISRSLLPRTFTEWERKTHEQLGGRWRLFVATLGGKILGFASVELRNNGIFLDAYYASPQIDEKYGVGATLLDQTERFRPRPLLPIDVLAVPGSPQTELLLEHGFKRAARVPLKASKIADGHSLDLVTLRRSLNSQYAG